MANLGGDFDPDAVEPRDNLDPVPAGIYAAEVTESDVVETKSGSGMMVKLTWKITEGPFEGRLIWDQINFKNANEVAQKIGQQSLAELCAAVGHRGPLSETEYLHSIPVRIRVAIETDKSGQYAPRNAVKRYMPYNASEAPAAAPRQAPATSAPPLAARQAAAVGGDRPWANRR